MRERRGQTGLRRRQQPAKVPSDKVAQWRRLKPEMLNVEPWARSLAIMDALRASHHHGSPPRDVIEWHASSRGVWYALIRASISSAT